MSGPNPLPGPEAGEENRFTYGTTLWGLTLELISYPAPMAYERRAIAEAMGFPPELWFEDAVENLGDVSGVCPSWLLARDDNLTLLDEEVAEALQDETVRAVLREVMRLPERERKIVLGIVRQFGEMSG